MIGPWSDENEPASMNKSYKFWPNIVPNCREKLYHYEILKVPRYENVSSPFMLKLSNMPQREFPQPNAKEDELLHWI